MPRTAAVTVKSGCPAAAALVAGSPDGAPAVAAARGRIARFFDLPVGKMFIPEDKGLGA